MKIDRLMGIVIYLLNNGRTSAQKLAAEFEVSPRTVMRDLDALDRAGIPIQSFCGADGGYQIMEGFVLEKQAATSREHGWLLAALQGMASACPDKGLERLLEKVRSVDPARDAAVSLDLSAAREDRRINGYLRLLEEAIREKRFVRFTYTNSHDEVKEVQAEPVCLQYKWYNWYLIVFHGKHQDYCMYKLVRMDSLEVTDQRSERDHDLSALRLEDSGGNIIHVRLRGKASVKAKCREYLNGEVTQELENGDFEFRFSVPDHEAFWYGALLSFGDKVRILEPPDLIVRIQETCRAVQAVYGPQKEEVIHKK